MNPFQKFILIVTASILSSINVAKAQDYGTGLIFEGDGVYQSIPLASPPLRGDLPDFVDMTPHFPSPGNQGLQGSCVGWAVGYGLKSFQEARERNLTGDAVVRYSPAFIYNQIKVDGCGGGAYITDALALLETTGIVSEGDFPYRQISCNAKPSEELVRQARPFRIKHWRKTNPQSISEIKSHLVGGYPVLIGMNVGRSFKNYSGGVLNKVDDNTGGHAMVVIGYDEKRQAFKLLNSWGRNWGEQGYGWVHYDAFRGSVVQAFVAQDWIVEPNPSPNPNEPDRVIDGKMVLASLRGTVLPTSAGVTPEGWDYYPVSLWMDLPETSKSQIASVEYWFHNDSFKNPKLPVSETNVFLTKWYGYGCIRNAEVRISLRDGQRLSVPFNLCDIWANGHTTGGNPVTSSTASWGK